MPSHEKMSTGDKSGAKKETVVVDKKKLRGALAMGAATIAVGSFAAGAGVGGAVAEANHEKSHLTKDQYEESVGDFLDNKENPNFYFEFDEDGNIESVVVTYEQAWKDGTMGKYSLDDTDGDTLYESGIVREIGGIRAAEFESENGIDIASAHKELRSRFAQK